MGEVYNFLLKITWFLRASAARNNIQNDITLVDDLIQRANSMALKAHLMAHDAGVTSTELFTHLHMLSSRTFLESPTVDLPQRDKDLLLVMSVGGSDLFGHDALKVHEWKRDTEEEKIKLISRVFDERDQRDKLRRSLSHLKVVLHAPSPTGLLWTLSLDLGPKTRTINSWVSPLADLPNSPPTSLVRAHSPKIKPLTETRKPLPLIL